MAARSRQVTEDQEELEEHSSPDEIRLLLPSFSPFEHMSGQAEFPEDIELADDGPLTSSVERVSPSESADFSAPADSPDGLEYGESLQAAGSGSPLLGSRRWRQRSHDVEEGGPSYKVASYSEGDSPTSKVAMIELSAHPTAPESSLPTQRAAAAAASSRFARQAVSSEDELSPFALSRKKVSRDMPPPSLLSQRERRALLASQSLERSLSADFQAKPPLKRFPFWRQGREKLNSTGPNSSDQAEGPSESAPSRRWLIDLMIKRPLDSPVQASQTSLIGRKRSILLPPNSHEESIGVHTTSSPSWSWTRRASQRPGMGVFRGRRHVQFDITEPDKREVKTGLWQQFWPLFMVDSWLMLIWDDFRLLLCLYELWSIPVRICFGTGYNILGGSICYFSNVSPSVWHNWLVVEVLIDMLWLLDIVMMVLSAIVLDKQEQEALQAVGMQLQQISANRNYELLSSRKARSLKKATSHGQMLTLAAQKTATRVRKHDEDDEWKILTERAVASAQMHNRRLQLPRFTTNLKNLRHQWQNYFGSLLLSMGGLVMLDWARRNLHLTGYLSRHFLLDLAACVGMYIPLMAHGPLWLYWAFQITRLPRLWKLHLFFRSRELMVHVDIRTVAFGKYIVLVLGFAHWVGCVYFALARWSDFNNSAYASTWLEQFFNQTMFNYSCNPGQGDVGGVYAIAIYKGLNALANLGYDPTIPERWDEMLYTIVVILLSIVMQAYILGTLNHYVVKKDAKLEAFRHQLQGVVQYCRARMLPMQLQNRLLQYFEFQHQKMLDSDGTRILRLLPESLRVKVASHQYSYIIERNNHLFRGCNPQFLNSLMLKLREHYLMPGEVMVREGDMAREVGFVAR
ncbi:hypothetical protein WJX84_001935, partial [Apatococcus fuscideae]